LQRAVALDAMKHVIRLITAPRADQIFALMRKSDAQGLLRTCPKTPEL